jgi:hypothetical protein
MDSVKVSTASFGTFGLWYIDIIPWILMVTIGFLNIIYLIHKIKHIRSL